MRIGLMKEMTNPQGNGPRIVQIAQKLARLSADMHVLITNTAPRYSGVEPGPIMRRVTIKVLIQSGI